jgi:hypothetical protein
MTWDKIEQWLTNPDEMGFVGERGADTTRVFPRATKPTTQTSYHLAKTCTHKVP